MATAGIGTEVRDRVQKIGEGSVTHLRAPRRMRAVGYVRQGFTEMNKPRTKPEGQRARIASCADVRDWHLVDTYEDIGWSSEDLDRPGLVALLSSRDFEIVIVDRTDRLTSKKTDLDFLLAVLEKRGVTCVPATWSWEPLAQYMRWWYRRRANPVYAALDAASEDDESTRVKERPAARMQQSLN